MRIRGYLAGDSIGLVDSRFRVVFVRFRGALGDEIGFRRPINCGNGGGRIRTCDSRAMSLNPESRWATWGTVSSGFREIEIGWDRLESAGLLASFLAPAGGQADSSEYSPGDRGGSFSVACHSPSSGFQ